MSVRSRTSSPSSVPEFLIHDSRRPRQRKNGRQALPRAREVIEAAKNEPAWRDVAKHMVHAWNEGMETLRSPRAAPHFRGLDTAITEAGFSGLRAPERNREQIGRSELLAPRKR